MNSNRSPLKPAPLKAGSRVALFAPGFTFRSEKFEAGRAALEKTYGVKTACLDTAFERDGYFAGSDQRRLDELYHWLTDAKTAALLAIRGGYGTARIYPALLERLRATKNLIPKIVMGYSDVTILLNGLFQDLGWITFHGPVLVSHVFQGESASLEVARNARIETETFRTALFTAQPLAPLRHADSKILFPGSARGRLVGGCLSLIASSIGTPYEIKADGRILFLEDAGERPYRIDRMLTQLIHAGLLDRVNGIVFGKMAACDPPPAQEFGHDTPDVIAAIREALAPLLARRPMPVAYDFPAGHGRPQATFPIGCEVELRADGPAPELRFLESACEPASRDTRRQ